MVCTNIEIHKMNDKRAPKKLMPTLKVKKKYIFLTKHFLYHFYHFT